MAGRSTSSGSGGGPDKNGIAMIATTAIATVAPPINSHRRELLFACGGVVPVGGRTVPIGGRLATVASRLVPLIVPGITGAGDEVDAGDLTDHVCGTSEVSAGGTGMAERDDAGVAVAGGSGAGGVSTISSSRGGACGMAKSGNSSLTLSKSHRESSFVVDVLPVDLLPVDDVNGTPAVDGGML